MSWFWDGSSLALPVEGHLFVRPGREFWVGDQAICAVHIEEGSLQELSFSFRLDGNFASEDGAVGLTYWCRGSLSWSSSSPS
jgi:hypothetical protein